MAKIPYPTPEALSPKVNELFEKIRANNWPVLNVNRIMAHSSGIARELIRLGAMLLAKTELNPRFRELAVMRVARFCGSKYEWAQHVPIALEAGLTREELKNITRWKTSGLFNEEDKAVLAFAEEVARDHQPAEETFAAVSAFLDNTALVELTTAVGYWSMIANLLNTFDVEIEAELGTEYEELWPEYDDQGNTRG